MRGYLRALGPGLVTGASDDDPSGIATYAQAGSPFGFGFLWTALLTFPLMAAVQEICDRTALATGRGLGELATERLGGKSRGVVIGLVGVLSALVERARSGLGQVIDVAMVDGVSLLTTLFHGMRAEGLWSEVHGTNILHAGNVRDELAAGRIC